MYTLSRKFLSPIKIIKILVPFGLIGLTMFFGIKLVSLYLDQGIVSLLIQIGVGALIYILLSVLYFYLFEKSMWTLAIKTLFKRERS